MKRLYIAFVLCASWAAVAHADPRNDHFFEQYKEAFEARYPGYTCSHEPYTTSPPYATPEVRKYYCDPPGANFLQFYRIQGNYNQKTGLVSVDYCNEAGCELVSAMLCNHSTGLCIWFEF